MDTARIDIAYRPLRVAWVIQSNDFDSFRKVVRYSHTLWGGRFNPIVFADRPSEARDLIDVFRADMLMPLGTSPEVAGFAAAYPHLPTPYYSDGLFSGNGENARAELLDIDNALSFARKRRTLEDLAKAEFRTFVWDPTDPLADLLLIQLGAYPAEEDCPINYGAIFAGPLRAIEETIPANEPLPTRIYDHPSIAYLSRHNLARHYTSQAGRDRAGFFVGDVTSLDDLVTFWNLQAVNITLQFIDRTDFARFEYLIPVAERLMLERVAHFGEHWRRIAVWARSENLDDARKHFTGRPLLLSGVDEVSWNGLNIKSPMIILGEASTLGVVSDSSGNPRVSFALADKPFSDDFWYHNQHLVASVSMLGDSALEWGHTFLPPYVPELNVFLGRSMLYARHEQFRIEPRQLGLVIEAGDKDANIRGISPEELFVELFKRAGVSAKPSAAGLLTRQLIKQLGGLNGARALKIPGVRRLIKERGPTNSFTGKVAFQTIGSADPDRPTASFKDHQRLFIERRTEPLLTPPMVFAYLVDKGLFRMGADLVCPACSLKGWTSLDSLATKVVCEFCGAEFDATRQLIADTWRYRRSGLLGRERNVHGAIPVVLTLQQLCVNLGLFGGALYLPSYELEGLPGTEFKKCEVDFLLLSQGREKSELIIGECKDQSEAIDPTDIENLKRVGALVPAERFEVYYLLSKLAGYSVEEIALASTLNDKYHNRAILLTVDELEPYHIYERSTDKVAKDSHASSAKDLARITTHVYFETKVPAKDD